MTRRQPQAPCGHEAAILEQLCRVGRPAPSDPFLVDHLGVCESCREIAAIAEALQAGDHARPPVTLPTASQVWWRARVRARLEAAYTAERPINLAQGMASAAVLGLAASVLGSVWLGGLSGALHLAQSAAQWLAAADVTGAMSSLLEGSRTMWLAIGAGACIAVLMPIAALLTLSGEEKL